MKIIDCDIPGPKIIEPKVFGDERGFFLESWNRETLSTEGLPAEFVQDNHSRSQAGVLRGLHFQNPNPQGKLVRVTSGAVYDVVVDLRKSSQHFGRWAGVELSAENKRMFWVPEGFAHGFLTLRDDTDFLYKCTSKYAPENEHSLAWDDAEIGIEWPLGDLKPIVSEKDQRGQSLREVAVFQ
ncbi:MAG: dTDP-4-dehydrorhamnose 3,5-epimerase [Erythrobacter sp.]